MQRKNAISTRETKSKILRNYCVVQNIDITFRPEEKSMRISFDSFGLQTWNIEVTSYFAERILRSSYPTISWYGQLYILTIIFHPFLHIKYWSFLCLNPFHLARDSNIQIYVVCQPHAYKVEKKHFINSTGYGFAAFVYVTNCLLCYVNFTLCKMCNVQTQQSLWAYFFPFVSIDTHQFSYHHCKKKCIWMSCTSQRAPEKIVNDRKTKSNKFIILLFSYGFVCEMSLMESVLMDPLWWFFTLWVGKCVFVCKGSGRRCTKDRPATEIEWHVETMKENKIVHQKMYQGKKPA